MNCVDVNGCCIKYLIICEWWLNKMVIMICEIKVKWMMKKVNFKIYYFFFMWMFLYCKNLRWYFFRFFMLKDCVYFVIYF